MVLSLNGSLLYRILGTRNLFPNTSIQQQQQQKNDEIVKKVNQQLFLWFLTLRQNYNVCSHTHIHIHTNTHTHINAFICSHEKKLWRKL